MQPPPADPCCGAALPCPAGLLSEFLEVLAGIVPPQQQEAAAAADGEGGQGGTKLDRQALPMTSKTLALARAKQNISAAKARSEEVLEHLDASRKVRARDGLPQGWQSCATLP